MTQVEAKVNHFPSMTVDGSSRIRLTSKVDTAGTAVSPTQLYPIDQSQIGRIAPSFPSKRHKPETPNPSAFLRRSTPALIVDVCGYKNRHILLIGNSEPEQ